MNSRQAPQGEIRLNLGCGDKLLAGYINVDAAPSRKGQKPDVICDLRNLDQFKTGIADEILAVHVIEHFYYWEVVSLLTGWHRVLKPGGLLVLECPNLLSACVEILRNPLQASLPGPEGQQGMWPLFGDPSWKDPLMCHKWAYTPESLSFVLNKSGFINVRQEKAQYKLREPRDMRIVGQKA